MFRGLKSKLEKSLNQSGIRSTFAKENQREGDETLVGDSKMSSASTSLVDLSEEMTNVVTPRSQDYFYHQSTPISEASGHTVDYGSPAILDLSNFESIEDLTNNPGNRQQMLSLQQRADPNSTANSVQVGRSRNSSVSSQRSDSYYFSHDSSLVPQPPNTGPFQHGLLSDVESVASEVDDPSSVSDDRAMDLVSKDDLMRFYRRMQAKNQKYTGKYSQVVAAYRELEKERDRLREVLTKCQDKSFQRISELREQIGLKDMAMRDVEVNYTMMLQEKEEVIKVLQMQVNILKQKFESEKLIDVDQEGPHEGSSGGVEGTDTKAILEENVALKEKVDKMSGLLSNCRATILKHREEIKELRTENDRLKEKAAEDRSELDSLDAKVAELRSQIESRDADGLKPALLRAERESTGGELEESRTQRELLASDLRSALEVESSLVAQLEALAAENERLARRAEETSGLLREETEARRNSERLLADREADALRWREKMSDLLDASGDDVSSVVGDNSNVNNSCASARSDGDESSGDPVGSARSEGSGSAGSWVTTDADLSSASAASIGRLPDPSEESERAWGELERKLKSRLGSGRELAGVERLRSSLERLTRDRAELRRSLSSSRTQARVFRNLCECVFKAVMLVKRRKKDDGDLSPRSDPLPPPLPTRDDSSDSGCLDWNSNANNNAPPAPGDSADGDCFANHLKVTRTSATRYDDKDEEGEDGEEEEGLGMHGVRQSVLAILKDGLGQTMKMLEEQKKRKRRRDMNFYRLSAGECAEDDENGKPRPEEASSEVGSSADGRPDELCLRAGVPALCSTPLRGFQLETIREDDDEDWETVDEEEEEDEAGCGGNPGPTLENEFIDDYETLFLGGGEQLGNASLRKLLINWKTGCERFELSLSPRKSEGSSGTDLNSSSAANDEKEEAEKKKGEEKEEGHLRSAYEQLKADRERLSTDYDRLRSEFEACLRSVDELRESRASTAEALERARDELHRTAEELKSREAAISELSRTANGLREDCAGLRTDLETAAAENVRLIAAAAEAAAAAVEDDEQLERLRRQLMASEEERERLLDEAGRQRLELEVSRQDCRSLTDENERLLTDLAGSEESLRVARESLARLRGERQLQVEEEERRSSLADQLALQREAELRGHVEVLRTSVDSLEEVNARLRRELFDSRRERDELASAAEEERRILEEELTREVERRDEAFRRLEADGQRLLLEARVELSDSESRRERFEEEVRRQREELEREKRDRNSEGSLTSSLERAESELAVAREELDKVQIQLEFLRGSLDKALEDNSDLEERLRSVSEDRDNLIEKSIRLESELTERFDRLAKSEAADLETLRSRVDELRRRAELSESTAEDLRAIVRSGEVERSKLESSMTDLEGRNSSLSAAYESLMAAGEAEVRRLEEAIGLARREATEREESLSGRLVEIQEELQKTRDEELASALRVAYDAQAAELQKRDEERSELLELRERLEGRADALVREKLDLTGELDRQRRETEEVRRHAEAAEDEIEKLNLDLENLQVEFEGRAETVKAIEVEIRSSKDALASERSARACLGRELEEERAAGISRCEKLRSETATLEGEVADSKLREERLTNELDGLRSEREALGSEVARLEELLAGERTASTDREAALRAEIARLEGLLSELKRSEEAELENEALQRNLASLKRRQEEELTEQLETTRERLRASEESLERMTANCSKDRQDLEAKLSELREERSRLKDEVATARRDLEEREAAVREATERRLEACSRLDEASRERELLKRSAEEERKRASKLEEELEQTTAEISRLIDAAREEAERTKSETERTAAEERHALETELERRESEWTARMNELKRKAEAKFRQLKSQRDESVRSRDESSAGLGAEVARLSEELGAREAQIRELSASAGEREERLEKLLSEERAELALRTERCLRLESSLARSKASLEEVRTELERKAEEEHERLRGEISLLGKKSEADLEEATRNLEETRRELEDARKDLETTSQRLEEAERRTEALERELVAARKEEEETENESSARTSLELKLADLERESETVKRKNQTLRQEVRRLRAENEANAKAAELDKSAEIERLKREYTEEMNERDEENNSKVKHLLREFQIKMAEKEKEYQDQFVSSLEKFENETDLRAMELEAELKELREELREKEELVDERCTRIEELTQQMERLRSKEDWDELSERNKELEARCLDLQRKIDKRATETKEPRKTDAEDEEEEEESIKRTEKKLQLNGSQQSLALEANGIAPTEFEYLKTVLFKYMLGSADKQTLTKVLCRIVRFSEAEEKQVMDQWKR